ncbi:MAG TPA: SRPBCC domain-containing protein [Actinocrinis sp.]|jgi:uncharacterized protein YndB with AHSA1/START domain|uniref:SRPBCC family protein n=1 Tax=Actinocrinis sp. TaxID=1920516 RepID=UPI002DDD8CBE|nr:SRPBCC domain-containing protein [Actinocrinis sp.]HEV3174061.1 SRPBCC domain-containing protein [Actinocrinis sp.]
MTDTSPVVVVRTTLPAPPNVVYDEWLDPEALTEWMCPRPARCLRVALDPQVGGELRIDIEDEGEQFFVSGTFLALDRPRLLRFTWSCSLWPDPDLVTTVSVHLDPQGNGDTLMTIRHAMLPPDVRIRHEHGWAKIADQLADGLAASATVSNESSREPHAGARNRR